MNKNYILTFVLLSVYILVGCSSSPKTLITTTNTETSQFRVAQYNIRYDSNADKNSGNGWDLRLIPLSSLILSHDFDIVGTQEGNTKQLSDLKEKMSAYDYVGHPYGGQDGNLHNCATYYKANKFEVLNKGVFWLSETPNVPSLGWDATDRRICYWVHFKEKRTAKEFYFFNVHFYWRLKEAREQSGPLMVAKMKELAGDLPIVCVGDFNSNAESSQMLAIKSMLADSHEITMTPRKGPEGTAFPGGVFQGTPNSRIDYVFVSNHFKVLDYEVYPDSYKDGRYPSDHFPVSCLLSLEK